MPGEAPPAAPAAPHPALQRPVICLVTDRSRLPDWRRTLVELVAAAAAAGAGLVHVREHGLDDRQLLVLTRRLIEAAAPAAVVVNDRADIALAAGAAGVHLRTDSFPADRLRAIVPPGFLIGRSVHSFAEAAAAAASGVDYLVMGTIFETSSKPGRAAAGVSALKDTCSSAGVPVLAIGGVTADNAHEIAAAGAAGIAAIGLFTDAVSEKGVVLKPALEDRIQRVRAAFRN